MIMKSPALFLIAAACMAPSLAHAASVFPSDPLVSYTAEPGDEFAPLIINGLVTATGLGLGNSLAAIEPGVSVPSSVYLATTTTSTTPAAAVANQQFMQFTVSAIPGALISPGALSFSASRGGLSSPRGWALTSSLNSFGSILASSDISTVQSNFESFQIDLSSFNPIATSVVFRIHLYAPAADNGIFLDNILFSGTAVPEPASALMGSVSICMFLLKRNRRANSVSTG